MFVIECDNEYYRDPLGAAFEPDSWTPSKEKAYWYDSYEEADETANAIWETIGGCVNVRDENGDLV